MIPLPLREVAAVVGGTVLGDSAVTVTAPAVLDGRQAEPGGLFVAFAGERADGHDYAAATTPSWSWPPRPGCESPS
jgi:UDP-N-acetylmuramoyl-tripeptide--D-alanyl-D-alanine ligase